MAEEERYEWERKEGEPNKWFSWFDRYRLFGPDRSILPIFNQWRAAKSRGIARNSPKSWRDAATRWSWRVRAEAWDEAERKRTNAEWQRRSDEQRQREWGLGSLMQERARQALELGVYYEDGEIAGVKLLEIKAGDVPKLAETGSKLSRLATGQPTESVEIVDTSDARERLARLLDRLAAPGKTQQDPEPVEQSGCDQTIV